jgi:hypothetical protein
MIFELMIQRRLTQQGIEFDPCVESRRSVMTLDCSRLAVMHADNDPPWRPIYLPFCGADRREGLLEFASRQTGRNSASTDAVDGKARPSYFGLTPGLPPGVPGGGIVGIVEPAAGGVCLISGSMPGGGVITRPTGSDRSWRFRSPAARSASSADRPPGGRSAPRPRRWLRRSREPLLQRDISGTFLPPNWPSPLRQTPPSLAGLICKRYRNRRH